MPPIQQHILNWLYSVLTSEYHDVNRTYGDVAQALSQYPSLSPRTDVHTFDNGTSALLLHIIGTLPVIFRGTTYRFPLSIRVPYAYPREARPDSMSIPRVRYTIRIWLAGPRFGINRHLLTSSPFCEMSSPESRLS
ncbi:Suppressor protein STP22 of temperature-sensitive alpha-factor like [Verticillium longisporum]|uniref:Suppressor protein STP22 of temperature-sensitive alpha-factor like n=1 Tax=Verticillium longisporum TaxID=100787 RepID=A0A8I2Z1D1_VERLO|nr:Suppressor protein STP22 of temperature-sensitive alpha-factor like [Verticillium longisporum]